MNYEKEYYKYKNRYINLKNIQLGGAKLSDIKSQVTQLMKQYNIPGLSLTICDDYKIVFSEGFGVKDKIKNEKITTKTQFQAGSVSKPIFALATMLLYHKKKIDIDKDINDYLKSWKVPNSYDLKNKLTLRELLTHTAGTTIGGFPGYNIKDKIPTV